MIPIKPVLKSQYRAALAMLKQAIDRCPENLWASTEYPNSFWHIAYHALFFLHMYLQPDSDSFHPWEKHRKEYEFMGSLPWPPHNQPNIEEPYTKDQVMEYLHICDEMIDAAVEKLDLDAPECGFWWYKMSKLEHQFVNIRHTQHHAAQLMDRLRQVAGVGVDWIGSETASFPRHE
jgi:hypothetical protein